MIPLLVQVQDEEEGGARQQFAFLRSPVRVGRGELNDLPLPKPFVSTYHGLVQFDRDGAHYVDLGSTNGSTVDDVPAPKHTPVPLRDGGVVAIGSYRLTFERRATAEVALPSHATAFALRASALRPAARAPSAARLEAAAPPPAPVPEPTPAPADPAAVAAAEAAIETASLDLDLDYTSYRGAWEHLRAAMDGALGGLEGAARALAVERLAARYPGASAEPEFRSLGGRAAPAAGPSRPTPAPSATPAGATVGTAPSAGPPGAAEAIAAPLAPDADLAAAALRLLTDFSETYVGEARLGTPRDVEAALARVAEVLEAFGRSFLELLRGYAEFANEMGVHAVHPEGAVHRARDVRQLLSYLLDARGAGRERELQRAFADFMVHQVALLRGVVEGARAVLDQLSPDALSATAPKGVWPMRGAALWKEFEGRFHELADEESALTDVLFGAEFARAYAAIAGKRAPGNGADGRARGGAATRAGGGDDEGADEAATPTPRSHEAS